MVTISLDNNDILLSVHFQDRYGLSPLMFPKSLGSLVSRVLILPALKLVKLSNKLIYLFVWTELRLVCVSVRPKNQFYFYAKFRKRKRSQEKFLKRNS